MSTLRADVGRLSVLLPPDAVRRINRSGPHAVLIWWVARRTVGLGVREAAGGWRAVPIRHVRWGRR